LTHIIGNFVRETCRKWVHGSVQLWKNKNNEDFVINSLQDNESFKAPVTLTFELVTQKQLGSSNCDDQSILEI
jgi:hypothetical protein